MADRAHDLLELQVYCLRQGMIELDLIGRRTNDWSSNLIGYVAILLKECTNDMKEKIHEGGHAPVFVGEHPMGMFPFHHRK